ncbi:hypothetical protein MUGA111182_09785 [Mucilaginibacter galii]|uniref:Uncharacterized protein n=1 Tax=Mucilaginibacter galii TaxID=2005073 RepID=A0A917N3N6_9SPHI|nr:hypothetical protein [Mucilaginibacter galii]GGI51187.1 hypothetical protein GCM10011425_23990 [Mucilaginibacter galii]
MPKFAYINEVKRRPIRAGFSIAPDIEVSDNQPQVPLSGYRIYGDVYIEIKDENEQPVAGDYLTVKYQTYYDGVAAGIQTATVIGTNYQIGRNVLLEDTSMSPLPVFGADIIGDVMENNGGYIPPPIYDAAISTVTINQTESGSGRKDGQITVIATSSAGNIQYSLDSVNWQYSATFSSLAGGGYIAYIKDAIGGTASKSFNIETVAGLLIADPTVEVGNGNLSRWSAAFNPIVFTYQRRDFYISDTYATAFGQNTTFVINASLSSNTISVTSGDMVYINTGDYDGVYKIAGVDTYNNTITIDVAYSSPANKTGFININKFKPYYQVNTQIEYEDPITLKTNTITCTHRPNLNGVVKADISSFLQSLLRAKDDSNFTRINFRDSNLSASYKIKYAEVWQNPATGGKAGDVYIDAGKPYYVMYSARQLGDTFGGNMAAYVPFKTVDGASRRARWITDFAEPAYSTGYPFDIGFIYGEELAGLDVYVEITPLDVNRNPLLNSIQVSYLLNEDRSFLLNQDSSKLVIKRLEIINKPITQTLARCVGLNRLRINTEFSEQASYFTLALKYTYSGNVTHTITQTQTVRIDDAVNDQSVYLRWIGLSGSWNYYRFVYNQELTLDVQNAVIVKNHILDWANQDATEDVISKSAGMKMKVMAEDLSVADIKGLQSIKYSPKVQMLVNKNPVKWQTVVLNTATFAEYETRNGQAPFSVTFNLPALNIQTQ